MRTGNRRGTVTWIAGFLIAAAACGSQPSASTTVPVSPTPGQTTASTAGSTQASEPITLTLWVYGSDSEEGKTLSETIPIFEQENPNINVEWTMVGWEVAREKVVTAGAAGTLPDVFEEWITNIPAFAEQGLYAPLEDYIDKSNYLPVGLAGGEWDGHQYALPSLMNAWVLNYRKDYLADAGITTAPETWDQFRDAAVAMTERNAAGDFDRIGFYVATQHPWKAASTWLSLLRSNGGTFFTSDGCQAAFNSSAGVEAATFMSDLLNVDKVDSPGSVQEEWLDLGQGKVAAVMTNGGVRNWKTEFPELVEKGEPGWLPTPHAEGQPSVTTFGAEYFMAAATSQHKPEAAKLVEFLTGPYAIERAKGSSYVPGRLSPERDEFLASDPFSSNYARIIEETGKPDPRHPMWPAISDIMTATIDQMYLEGVDPQVALDGAAEQVNGIIADSSCGVES